MLSTPKTPLVSIIPCIWDWEVIFIVFNTKKPIILYWRLVFWHKRQGRWFGSQKHMHLGLKIMFLAFSFIYFSSLLLDGEFGAECMCFGVQEIYFSICFFNFASLSIGGHFPSICTLFCIWKTSKTTYPRAHLCQKITY